MLRLGEPRGLGDADVKALSKQLHQAAAAYAKEGEICCFQIINLCQEFLQAGRAGRVGEQISPSARAGAGASCWAGPANASRGWSLPPC